MNKVNTSPYLGFININPNKEYYVSEYEVKDDDFLGTLNIKLDRPANIYIFPTRYDEITGLYVSDGDGIFKETTPYYDFETSLSQAMGTKFVIILEYDGMKLGELVPIEPEIDFKRMTIGDIYHSDFYMFESKSGIPYPAHDIGTYSRYEFDIQQTSSGVGYQRVGILYNLTQSSDSTITLENVTKHCRTFIQGILGYDYRPVILNDFNVSISESSSTILEAVLFNLNLLRNKYVQNKVILMAEELSTKATGKNDLLKVLTDIMHEANYNKTVDLVEQLVELSYDYTSTIIKMAQSMQDLIDDTRITQNIKLFLEGLYDDKVSSSELSELGYSTGLLSTLQCVMVDVFNSGLTIVKSLNNMVQSNVVSGRLDIQGQSIYTGKYASSKILVGHFHENERGYLKHTVATDRYGKTHKDPFVKNKEQWGKEEDYIYLDLLHSTKNIFANSNKIIRGVALLTDKQFKEPPKGNIKFKFLDKDKYDKEQIEEEVLPAEEFTDVYSAAYRAKKSFDKEIGGSESFYVLTNKNDYIKMFVRQEGMNVDYTFWYSQRIGTYTYSFVDEAGNKIQDDYIVRNKPTNAYEAPEYINVTPKTRAITENKLYYKLIGPKGVQYSSARWKDDEFFITFKYKLITANFTFELKDQDNELIQFADDSIFTYRDLNESGTGQLSSTYNVKGSELVSPEDKNPIKYEDVPSITYNAPIYIQINEYNKYKVPGQSLWVNLTANELNPEVNTLVQYELIKSKFKYSFIDEKNNYLINSVDYPLGVTAEHEADNIIHTDSMSDNEYYILENKPTNTDLYPQADLEKYPLVKLKASEFQNIVSFNFIYKRLLGNVKINFLNSEDDSPIDIEEYKNGKEFKQVASVKTMKEGTEILTGIAPEILIPSEFEKNKNKKWILDTEKSNSYPELIITPDKTEIVYNFYYKTEYKKISVRYLLDSSCEQRTYTKYLLIDENDTILAKFDLSDILFDFNEYGLSIKLDKNVMDNGTPTTPDQLQTSEQKYNGEVRPQNEVETSDHASRFGVIFRGNFEVDLKKAEESTNKTIKLVGFINLPGIGTTGLHGSGHRIFELRYNSEDLKTKFAQFVPVDFPRLSEISFDNPQFDTGMKFQTSSGSETRGRVFMTIDLTKELDEEIFTIHPGSDISNLNNSIEGVFTIS